jgi:hypothetical protein
MLRLFQIFSQAAMQGAKTPAAQGFLAKNSGKLLATGATVGVVGGTTVVGDIRNNGGDGWVSNAFQWMNQAPGEGGARAQAGIMAEGFYATIEQIGRGISLICKGIGLKEDLGIGLQNWARDGMEIPPLTTDVFGRTLPGVTAPRVAGEPSLETEKALDGVTPVTAENALTLENLTNDLAQPVTFEGFLHGLNVAKDAAIDVGIDITSLPAQALDLLDESIDGALKIVGGGTGAETRDLSESWKDAIDGTIRTVIPRTELTSAFDQALYGTIDFASYFIPYAGQAKLAGDLTQGVENFKGTHNPFVSTNDFNL